MMQTLIRKAEPSDHGLILSSWLQSYRKKAGQPLAPKPIYYKEHESKIKSHLSGAWVLCNSQDLEQVLGWVCATNGAIHFVYVKELFRGNSFAKQLMAHASKLEPIHYFTHHTTNHKKFVGELIFNPYLF